MGLTTLGLIAIALVLVILFQISQANEMVGSLKGEEKQRASSDNVNAILMMVFSIGFIVLTVWSAWYYRDFYLPEPSSIHGDWIRDMFFWTLVATVPVFIGANFVLFWFAWRYKREEGKKAYFYPENHKLELIWTVIPAIVMVLLVFEGMRNWLKITGPAPEEAIILEATGQQFKWDLRYAGKDNLLGTKSVKYIGSENPMGQDWADANNKDDFNTDTLYLPLNTPVKVKINALDVLHSFYLPHFRVKMDAVPGIPTQFWFTPTKTTEFMRKELDNPAFNYELACAELCGSGHFNMRKVVKVVEKAEFDQWLNKQEPTYAKLGKPAPPIDPFKKKLKKKHDHQDDHDHASNKDKSGKLSGL